MTTAEALYRDSLLKWLRNRREYPDDNTPEPGPQWENLAFDDRNSGVIIDELRRIRAEVIRDFERGERETSS